MILFSDLSYSFHFLTVDPLSFFCPFNSSSLLDLSLRSNLLSIYLTSIEVSVLKLNWDFWITIEAFWNRIKILKYVCDFLIFIENSQISTIGIFNWGFWNSELNKDFKKRLWLSNVHWEFSNIYNSDFIEISELQLRLSEIKLKLWNTFVIFLYSFRILKSNWDFLLFNWKFWITIETFWN